MNSLSQLTQHCETTKKHILSAFPQSVWTQNRSGFSRCRGLPCLALRNLENGCQGVLSFFRFLCPGCNLFHLMVSQSRSIRQIYCETSSKLVTGQHETLRSPTVLFDAAASCPENTGFVPKNVAVKAGLSTHQWSNHRCCCLLHVIHRVIQVPLK